MAGGVEEIDSAHAIGACMHAPCGYDFRNSTEASFSGAPQRGQ